MTIISDEISYNLPIFARNIGPGYSLEPPHRGLYTQQKSSAQMGYRVYPILARNDFINSNNISLFTKINLQQLGAFKIVIQGTLTKL